MKILCTNTRAREIQAETLAEDIIDIADNAKEDAASVAKARLQTDVRKWYASKTAPKKYGDRVNQEITSVNENINVNMELTDKELEKRLMELGHGRNKSQLTEKLSNTASLSKASDKACSNKPT